MPLLAVFGFGAVGVLALLLRRSASGASNASAAAPSAVVVNAVLHGGSAAEKASVLRAYQAEKGLAVTGLYTNDVRAALVADGIDSPPLATDGSDS